MRTRINSMLTAFVLSGLAPIALFAQDEPVAGCGTYDDQLTPEQAQYLVDQDLAIEEPEGEVATIQRCDVDGNNVINNDDLFIIRAHRGELATHPDDPMDWDGNGVIHGRDVGGCAAACNSNGKNGCAVKEGDAEEEAGVIEAATAGAMESTADPAACYQVDDFDGDGEEDFVGLYSSTSEEEDRGEWTLEVVILNKKDDGAGGKEVQHITFPFTGEILKDTQQVTQHLSKHLCDTGQCMVDLNPGTLMIDKPAIVSYRDGERKVIYYFVDGEVRRAYYGIDD